VDAPCSGEGMFRKDPGAINEWSENNVILCADRQRKIVGEVWDALKQDGILVYSTCTYNREENEDNVEWICNELGAELLKIDLNGINDITETDFGYRFYPHVHGEKVFFFLFSEKIAVLFIQNNISRILKKEQNLLIKVSFLFSSVNQRNGLLLTIIISSELTSPTN